MCNDIESNSLMNKMTKLLYLGLIGLGAYLLSQTRLAKGIVYGIITLMFAWIILWIIIPKIISLKNDCYKKTAITNLSSDIIGYIERSDSQTVTAKEIIDKLQKENSTLKEFSFKNKDTISRVKSIEAIIEASNQSNLILIAKIDKANASMNETVKKMLVMRQEIEASEKNIKADSLVYNEAYSGLKEQFSKLGNELDLKKMELKVAQIDCKNSEREINTLKADIGRINFVAAVRNY